MTYLEFKDNILLACSKRTDSVAEQIKHRVINCVDLVQVGARYHENCRSKFWLGTIAASQSQETTKGRPPDQLKSDRFEQLCRFDFKTT